MYIIIVTLNFKFRCHYDMFLSREWTRRENESCKTTLKLAISTIHHFILLKFEIRCLLRKYQVWPPRLLMQAARRPRINLT